MAIKHFEHPCTVHFMGSHPGTFNIDRDDEAMTIKGEAIVKIIKNIHYPFETGTYEPHEDGSVHYNAKLKSCYLMHYCPSYLTGKKNHARMVNTNCGKYSYVYQRKIIA